MIKAVMVHLWGQRVGVVTLNHHGLPMFEYLPEFVASGLELAPIRMPLVAGRVYAFPENLTQTEFQPTFHGLPGLLADSLPEKFGNRLLNLMLARQGRSLDDLTPLDRLTYLGQRGMGALEFEPDMDSGHDTITPIEVAELVETARAVLDQHKGVIITPSDISLQKLISVGTSAGGAKAKAVIAMHEQTGDIVSGQGQAPEGYSHWLLKFDSIDNEELATSNEIGRIEYAYHLMAVEAGIAMTECRLLETQGLAHFMTRRFDRLPAGTSPHNKVHIQTFCALTHADRNPPGLYGYEHLFQTARKLGCTTREREQLFRRMAFNILARNQDDHSKNFAFAMDFDGTWFVAPAYDICFSYKPGNRFIDSHQLSCNGKRDGFTREDLINAAKSTDIKRSNEIIAEVTAALNMWENCANNAGLSEQRMQVIKTTFRRI